MDTFVVNEGFKVVIAKKSIFRIKEQEKYFHTRSHDEGWGYDEVYYPLICKHFHI